MFNNADTENKTQVRELLEKIDTMIKRKKKQPFYVKGAAHVQYPWAKIIWIALPVVVLLAIRMMSTKKPMSVESLSQSSSVQEVICNEVVTKKATESLVPDQPEYILEPREQLLQMLHRIDFKWKVLIAIPIGLWASWWILKNLKK